MAIHAQNEIGTGFPEDQVANGRALDAIERNIAVALHPVFQAAKSLRGGTTGVIIDYKNFGLVGDFGMVKPECLN